MRVRDSLIKELKEGNFKSFGYIFKKMSKEAPILLLDRVAVLIPDALFIKLKFRATMGYWPDLKKPKTFSEKLQWLKLYDRKPEYTTMVDKAEAKKWVAERIGEEYIIPTIGVWDSVEEVDWDILPNQFVMKCTHDSGGIVICKDKKSLDIDDAKKTLKRFQHRRYFYQNREWPYKNVKPRIIAEQYIEPRPNVKDLTDYKWYCFNGEPKYCQVIQDRSTNETIDFFDTEWNHQEFIGLNTAAGPAAEQPTRPANLDIQIQIARELSKDMTFSRIDLYETNENEYFGEITFYPASGFGLFAPDQYNEILGKMISLPGELQGGVIIKWKKDGELEITQPDLPDYKIFCFNGTPKFLFVATGRQKHDTRFDFYDADFNHLDLINGHPVADIQPDKPKNFDIMLGLAGKLSKDMPQLRVDFYNCNGNIYFGELTFYHWSGMVPFEPQKWDYEFGQLLNLPKY